MITLYIGVVSNVVDLRCISQNSSHSLLYITFISDPVLVMVLEKVNAVADWRALIGPTDAQKAKITHPHRLFLFVNHNILICFLFTSAILLVLLSFNCRVCI